MGEPKSTRHRDALRAAWLEEGESDEWLRTTVAWQNAEVSDGLDDLRAAFRSALRELWNGLRRKR